MTGEEGIPKGREENAGEVTTPSEVKVQEVARQLEKEGVKKEGFRQEENVGNQKVKQRRQEKKDI